MVNVNGVTIANDKDLKDAKEELKSLRKLLRHVRQFLIDEEDDDMRDVWVSDIYNYQKDIKNLKAAIKQYEQEAK